MFPAAPLPPSGGCAGPVSPEAMADPQPLSERLYNNADSFAHVFDQAWHSHDQAATAEPVRLSKEEKLALILERIADHPFALSDPARARQVAEFRIRLLGL
jgi:hypothetical protein